MVVHNSHSVQFLLYMYIHTVICGNALSMPVTSTASHSLHFVSAISVLIHIHMYIVKRLYSISGGAQAVVF